MEEARFSSRNVGNHVQGYVRGIFSLTGEVQAKEMACEE